MTAEADQMTTRKAFLYGYHDAICVFESACEEMFYQNKRSCWLNSELAISYMEGFKAAFLDKEVAKL